MTTYDVIIINILLQTFVPADVLRLPHPSSRHLGQLQKYRGTDESFFSRELSCITFYDIIKTIIYSISIIVLTIYLVQIALHGSVLAMAWMYVGNLGLSYAAALLLSLVFEAPFLNLQKIFGI